MPSTGKNWLDRFFGRRVQPNKMNELTIFFNQGTKMKRRDFLKTATAAVIGATPLTCVFASTAEAEAEESFEAKRCREIREQYGRAILHNHSTLVDARLEGENIRASFCLPHDAFDKQSIPTKAGYLESAKATNFRRVFGQTVLQPSTVILVLESFSRLSSLTAIDGSVYYMAMLFDVTVTIKATEKLKWMRDQLFDVLDSQLDQKPRKLKAKDLIVLDDE
jgi:hypothetical protein